MATAHHSLSKGARTQTLLLTYCQTSRVSPSEFNPSNTRTCPLLVNPMRAKLQAAIFINLVSFPRSSRESPVSGKSGRSGRAGSLIGSILTFQVRHGIIVLIGRTLVIPASKRSLPMVSESGHHTYTSPDPVRTAQNEKPVSAWMGVVSGEEQSSEGETSRIGQPQSLNIQTVELASRATEEIEPQLK